MFLFLDILVTFFNCTNPPTPIDLIGNESGSARRRTCSYEAGRRPNIQIMWWALAGIFKKQKKRTMDKRYIGVHMGRQSHHRRKLSDYSCFFFLFFFVALLARDMKYSVLAFFTFRVKIKKGCEL
jgi:hypothetical protein